MAKSPRARRPARPRRPGNTRTELASVRREITANADAITELRREVEIHIRRMAAMQAEIDHLRSRLSH